MAILPRYRRVGVEAAAPQRIDYSPLAQEGARLGNAISSNVDRMSDFVYREQARRAEMAGQEAVREQGALPMLERLAEQGGPGISIAEQSAYEAANRLAVAEIQFEAENQIASILEAAEQAGTGFTTVAAQLEDVVDGFSASLGYLAPETAGLLQQRLQKASQSASQRYAKYYQSRARAAGAARRSAQSVAISNSLVDLARLEGMTPDALYASVTEQKQTLIDSGVSESKAEKWADATYKVALQENTNARARSMPLTDLRAEIEKGLTSTEPIPGRTLTESQREYSTLSSVYNARIAGKNAELKALERDIVSSTNILNAGGVVNAEDIADIQTRAEELEPLFPGVSKDAAQFAGRVDYTNNIRGKSVAELETEMANVMAGGLNYGGAGMDTQEEVARRDIVAKALSVGKAAQAEAVRQNKEAAIPYIDEFQTATRVFQNALSVARPDMAVVELAIETAQNAASQIDPSLVTPEMKDTLVELSQIAESVTKWQGAAPSALLAEHNRLKAEIQGADLPEGVTAIEQIEMNQNQRKILESYMASQAKAFDEGDGVSWARSQGVQYLDESTSSSREIGRSLDFTSEDGLTASLGERLKDVEFVESRYGASGQSILSSDEIEFLTNRLANGTPSQAVGLLGVITGQGDEVTERILNELSVEGPDARFFAAVGGLYQEGGIHANTAAQAIEGFQIMKDPDLRPPVVGSKDFAVAVRGAFGTAFSNGGMLRAQQASEAVVSALYAREARLVDQSLADTLDESRLAELRDFALGTAQIVQIADRDVLLEGGLEINLLKKFLKDPEFDNGAARFGIVDIPGYSTKGANLSAISGGGWYPILQPAPDNTLRYSFATGSGADRFFWVDQTTGNRVYMDLYTVQELLASSLRSAQTHISAGMVPPAPDPTDPYLKKGPLTPTIEGANIGIGGFADPDERIQPIEPISSQSTAKAMRAPRLPGQGRSGQ